MPVLLHASSGGEFGAFSSVLPGKELLVCYPFSCTLDRLKSSEMCCISFIQGQKTTQFDWTGMMCVILSVRVLSTSRAAVTVTPELRWPSGQLWPIAWDFKSSHRSWQLFFMTNIKMICKDTKHREREDSDAVRRCQGVCLFALIVAMDVRGH